MQTEAHTIGKIVVLAGLRNRNDLGRTTGLSDLDTPVKRPVVNGIDSPIRNRGIPIEEDTTTILM